MYILLLYMVCHYTTWNALAGPPGSSPTCGDFFDFAAVLLLLVVALLVLVVAAELVLGLVSCLVSFFFSGLL